MVSNSHTVTWVMSQMAGPQRGQLVAGAVGGAVLGPMALAMLRPTEQSTPQQGS
jgi:hypothetical protein